MSRLQEVLQKVKEGVLFCEVCGNVSERSAAVLRRRRRTAIVCVVEEPKDVIAVERTRECTAANTGGRGAGPAGGVGPDGLRIRELLAGSVARARRRTRPRSPK